MSYSTDPLPVTRQGDILLMPLVAVDEWAVQEGVIDADTLTQLRDDLTKKCVGRQFVESGRTYEVYQVLLPVNGDLEFKARCFPVQQNPRVQTAELAVTA